ncbi:NAD(P)-binding domain [Trinorchestia longiramus]|nr:NAD(P)-binding domain [Trinorchestia longiramus]
MLMAWAGSAVFHIHKLKASASSRIINVSSIYYIKNELDLADINFERRKYSFLRAYCQSKLANILFTKELARRLHGTGVVANCLHPGNGDTDILKGPNPNTRKFIRQIVARFGAYLCRTAEQAAQTQIYLAVSEEGGTQSGCYYSNCEKSNLYFGANDMDLGKRLWDASCLAVQLAPEETIREVMEDAAPNSRVQPHKQ